MSENKWTAGPHPALFVDSTVGTWKAMVDTDDATWHVRGPDPDNEAHYASGEATNADVAGGRRSISRVGLQRPKSRPVLTS